MTAINNIYTPFVKFQIGDKDLTIVPDKNVVLELTVNKPGEGVCNANITVYDDTAFELEELIAKSRLTTLANDFYIQYGYSFQRESSVIKQIMLDYNMQFQSGGVQLQIEMCSNALVTVGQPKIRSFKERHIHDIVRSIALEERWEIGYIEECVPVKDGTKLKSFSQNNVSTKKFITDLAQYAISKKTNQGGFKLYFTEKGGKTYINFCSSQYANIPKFNYEYTVFHPENSEVKNFAPNFSGALRALSFGETMIGVGYDPIKKTHYEVSYNAKTNSSQVVLAPKRDGVQSTKVYDFGNLTIDEAKVHLANKWYLYGDPNTEATLDLLGNPDIFTNDTVSVIVYDKHGFPHHTSGIYLVNGVTDTIQGGDFTTSCQLHRNGSNLGYINNVGRRNY